MSWFNKKWALPKECELVDMFPQKYSFRVEHYVPGLRDRIGWNSEVLYHTADEAHKAGEELLMSMYTHGIRHHSKYLPPHRIQSSEIFVYCDGKKVPCEHL